MPFYVRDEGWEGTREHRKDLVQKILLLELLILSKPTLPAKGLELD